MDVSRRSIQRAVKGLPPHTRAAVEDATPVDIARPSH